MDQSNKTPFDVLDDLAALNPDERAERLRLMNLTPEVKRHVERMLQEEGSAAGELLEAAPPLVRGVLGGLTPEGRRRLPADDSEGAAGGTVAGFEIVRLIGEGGMGAVYEARQSSPRRTVALKLVRTAFVSPSLLKRFQLEVEVLGRLEHPGIARIYEAGTATALSGAPQPYFAMEFVHGVSLLEYAKLKALDVRQRVELLIKVADAVHYAHQQSVVHRDLKPANILVEVGTGQPKVLDFGVARATDADVYAATTQTEVGQIIGTLAYMSPEQASGDSMGVDTRTDVYALGAIAYELLSGKRPLRLGGKGIHEASRIIREEEPTRLGAIDPTFRGDLETVVARAIEKDRERRYASASEFAADLRRYLADDPILARPPSTAYVLRKFARRRKGLVIGVATVFAVLVLGVIGTMTGLVRATRESITARHAERTAQESAATARDAERAMRRASYANLIALADSQVREGNTLGAKRSLADCPPELRGWEWDRLHRISDTSLSTIRLGDGRPCAFLCVSPDGSRILWGDGAKAFVTDAAAGTTNCSMDFAGRMRKDFGPLVTRALPTEPVTAIRGEWEPSGARVAIACSDYTIRICNAVDGRLLETLDLPPPPTTPTVAWPDPRRLPRVLSWGGPTNLLAAGDLSDVVVWDVNQSAAATQPAPPIAHWSVGSEIYTLLWTATEDRLITSTDSHGNGVWMARTGAPTNSLEGKGVPMHWDATRARIMGLATDSTGAGQLAIWSVYTSKSMKPLTADPRGLGALAVNANGDSIAISVGAVAKIIEPNDARVLRQFIGHTDNVTYMRWSADGSRLITATARGEVKRWDPTTDHDDCLVFREHSLGAHGVAWSPDGGRIVSTGVAAENDVFVWEPATARVLSKMKFPNSLRTEMAWHPDGTRFALLADDAVTRVFNANPLREMLQIAEPDHKREMPVSLSWSPDGKRVAIGDRAGRVIMYDAANAKRLWDDPQGRRVAWTRDGRRIAVSGGVSAALRVLDATTYAEIFHTPAVHRINPETGEALHGEDLGGGDLPGSPIRHIQWNADSTRILTGGAFSPLTIWDAGTGQPVVSFHGPEAFALDAAWSSDGRRIASIRGREAHVWDAGTGQLLLTIPGHDRPIDAMAWSPDGKRLVTASQDGTVKVWW